MTKSLFCPRVLVADWDAEARAVLQNMFERRGCDVFRCVCPTQLRDMLEALSGEQPLLPIQMLVCDLSFVETLGLEYFVTLSTSVPQPAFVIKTDRRNSEIIDQLGRMLGMTIVEDVYDHHAQSSLLRQLVEVQQRHWTHWKPPASST